MTRRPLPSSSVTANVDTPSTRPNPSTALWSAHRHLGLHQLYVSADWRFIVCLVQAPSKKVGKKSTTAAPPKKGAAATQQGKVAKVRNHDYR